MTTSGGRIKSRAFELRMERQKRLGRTVPVLEVARETGLARSAITRLEENETERFDGNVLAALCAYYGVGIGDLLEYQADAEAVSPGNRTASLTAMVSTC